MHLPFTALFPREQQDHYGPSNIRATFEKYYQRTLPALIQQNLQQMLINGM